MFSLAEAWHWAQVGFCVAAGGLIAVGIPYLLLVAMGPWQPGRAVPDPHCSHCCPVKREEERYRF